MNYSLPSIQNTTVEGKTILLRADLDVPLSEVRSIEDDTRLVCGVSTIDYLLQKGAKVVVIGHLGRPEGEDYESRSKNQGLSLKPVARWFLKKFRIQPFDSAQGKNSEFRIQKIGEFDGWKINEQLVLLENLRFYKEEEENDLEFSKQLASLADIYVNDAFAVSHRAHASTVGVAKLLPHFAGLRLLQEVKTLRSAIENPKRPLAVVIGGAKLETKLPLVSKMIKVADMVLVGGKIAGEREEILHSQGMTTAKIIIADLNEDKTDITKKSLDQFIQKIQGVQTIIWNGPVGKIQSSDIRAQISDEDTEKGTSELAKAISDSNAYTIVGGGDTLDFLKRNGFAGKFSFESTGGGAMLSFLSGEKLPALEVLMS